MSMLSRYKKAGGFKQLLNLIETCGPQKQEKFLAIVEQEDPRWATALKKKMLSIEKIFSWDDMVLAEIAIRLQELTLATALHGFQPAQKDRLMKTFSASQKRKIDDIFNTKKPTPAELSTIMMKIIEQVRALINDGSLRAQDFDPAIVIESNVEELISKEAVTIVDMRTDAPSEESETEETPLQFNIPSAPESTPGKNGGGDSEFLRMQLHALTSENKKLKTQMKALQDKLDQIRRIA